MFVCVYECVFIRVCFGLNLCVFGCVCARLRACWLLCVTIWVYKAYESGCVIINIYNLIINIGNITILSVKSQIQAIHCLVPFSTMTFDDVLLMFII